MQFQLSTRDKTRQTNNGDGLLRVFLLIIFKDIVSEFNPTGFLPWCHCRPLVASALPTAFGFAPTPANNSKAHLLVIIKFWEIETLLVFGLEHRAKLIFLIQQEGFIIKFRLNSILTILFRPALLIFPFPLFVVLC